MSICLITLIINACFLVKLITHNGDYYFSRVLEFMGPIWFNQALFLRVFKDKKKQKKLCLVADVAQMEGRSKWSDPRLFGTVFHGCGVCKEYKPITAVS